MNVTLDDLDHFEKVADDFIEGDESANGNPYALRDIVLTLVAQHRRCLIAEDVYSSLLTNLHRRAYYYRSRRKLSLEEAAAEIGIPTRTLKRFEAEDGIDPPLSVVRKLIVWTEDQNTYPRVTRLAAPEPTTKE